MNIFHFLPQSMIGLWRILPQSIMHDIVSYMIDIPLIIKKNRIMIVGCIQKYRESYVLCDENGDFCADLITTFNDNRHNIPSFHSCNSADCHKFKFPEPTIWNASVLPKMGKVWFYSTDLDGEDGDLNYLICLAELKIAFLESIQGFVPGKEERMTYLHELIEEMKYNQYFDLVNFHNKYDWGFFGTSSAIAIQEYLHSHKECVVLAFYPDEITLWQERIHKKDELFINPKYECQNINSHVFQELTEAYRYHCDKQCIGKMMRL